MFKVGDKVVYVNYNEQHGISDHNFEWPLYTIFTVSHAPFKTEGTYAVRLKEVGDEWYMPLTCLKLLTIKKPVTNDIEWLDRVQQNFKE